MMIKTDDFEAFKQKCNDKIDWKKMGKDMEIIEVLAITNEGKSNNKLGFKIMTPLRSAFRTQGAMSSWPGNFKPGGKGMRLLFTDGHGGPVTIVFDNSVKGVGAQLQEHYGVDNPPLNGAPFKALIKAFTKGCNEPIAEFSANGWSDNGLHQAVFLGLHDDDSAAIDYVQLLTQPMDQSDKGEFSIGSIYLVV